MDAIAVRAGTGLLVAATLTLAIAARDDVSSEAAGPQTLVLLPMPMPMPMPMPTVEDRAVALANERFPDDRQDRFEVFSAESLGSLRAVFVQRSTGECGGCGALVVAVVFDGDRILISELGEYGRFGKGADRIELVNVVGRPVIVVDESFTLQGGSRWYREYFLVGRDSIDEQLCFQIAGTDHDRGIAWKASNWIAAEGTMYFTGNYTTGGEHEPPMRGFSFSFENGWERWQGEGRCLDPRSPPDEVERLSASSSWPSPSPW